MKQLRLRYPYFQFEVRKGSIRLLILAIYCATSLTNIQAQVFDDQSFRDRAERGLRACYNADFDSAHVQFLALQADYPSHPGPVFLLALNRWWQSYICTQEHFHPYIFDQLNQALYLNKAFRKQSAYALEYTFFQYMCHAFIARLHVLRRAWWKGAQAGRKALPYLKKGFAFQALAPEFYFSSGIYHYYAATYPEKHPVIKPLMIFFPNGDAELGLTELEQAATRPNFAQTEAQYYLGDIYLESERERSAAKAWKKRLHQQFPNSVWFKVDYARCLRMMKEYEQARALLLPVRERFEALPQAFQRPYNSSETQLTTYQMIRVYAELGLCVWLNEKDAASAQALFQASLKMATISGADYSPFRAENHYYLGQCWEHLGESLLARQAYEAALAEPENQSVQKQAKARLKALRN